MKFVFFFFLLFIKSRKVTRLIVIYLNLLIMLAFNKKLTNIGFTNNQIKKSQASKEQAKKLRKVYKRTKIT